MKDRGSLYHSPLFSGITTADIALIAQTVLYKRYRRGEFIFTAGEKAQALYILNDGHVKLLHRDPKGKETIIHIYRPDEVFGELLLAEDYRIFSAQAMEGALVSVISKENFLYLLQKIPVLNINFILFLSEHIKNLKQELADFGHASSLERLAKTLLKLARDHGETAEEGILIHLPVTHEILADMIGSSRETVTIYLNHLKKEGLVIGKGRKIVVKVEETRQYLQNLSEKGIKKGGMLPLVGQEGFKPLS